MFVCQNCGYESPKWSGRCPECGSWSSFVEEIREKKAKKNSGWSSSYSEKPVPIVEVKSLSEERTETGISEFDRVLGGGLVKGSVVLISGEPGIGKSTFLLQVASLLARKSKVLYVTAEESAEQVSLRAKRLRIGEKKLYVLPQNNLEEVMKQVDLLKPEFVIYDSVQTLYLPSLESAPGSVSQVRECSAYITRISKVRKLTSLIVGHVTKEGNIAGPKVLEHVVDAVFQFEGDRGYNLRVLKSLKNRFGSTGEIAVFEMTGRGLEEVKNPSQFFLSERPLGKPGSAVFVGIEGSRPILLEVQALVTRAVFATPQRRAKGISPNRLSIIVATLEKELGFPLRNFDVFVNVVGGITVDEPAVDLPIAAAIVSSYLNKPVDESLALFGEIGLAGEVRRVRLEEMRKKEAEKNGFEVLTDIKHVSEITKRILI